MKLFHTFTSLPQDSIITELTHEASDGVSLAARVSSVLFVLRSERSELLQQCLYDTEIHQDDWGTWTQLLQKQTHVVQNQ